MRSTNAPFRSNFYPWNGVSAIFFSNYVTNVHSHNTLQIVSDLQTQFRCRIGDSPWSKYNDAAYEAGLTDNSHFHKMLVNMFGILPSQFLRDNQVMDILTCDTSPLNFETTVYDEYMQIEKVYR